MFVLHARLCVRRGAGCIRRRRLPGPEVVGAQGLQQSGTQPRTPPEKLWRGVACGVVSDLVHGAKGGEGWGTVSQTIRSDVPAQLSVMWPPLLCLGRLHLLHYVAGLLGQVVLVRRRSRLRR